MQISKLAPNGRKVSNEASSVVTSMRMVSWSPPHKLLMRREFAGPMPRSRPVARLLLDYGMIICKDHHTGRWVLSTSLAGCHIHVWGANVAYDYLGLVVGGYRIVRLRPGKLGKGAIGTGAARGRDFASGHRRAAAGPRAKAAGAPPGHAACDDTPTASAPTNGPSDGSRL